MLLYQISVMKTSNFHPSKPQNIPLFISKMHNRFSVEQSFLFLTPPSSYATLLLLSTYCPSCLQGYRVCCFWFI